VRSWLSWLPHPFVRRRYATKQVPAVALNIKEYRYLSIRLNARRGNEFDTRGDHPRVRRFEIIDAQE
jgi:hypothetical protein